MGGNKLINQKKSKPKSTDKDKCPQNQPTQLIDQSKIKKPKRKKTYEFCTVDGLSTGTVVVGEVTPLTHESRDDTMERRSGVSESFFTSTQGTELTITINNWSFEICCVKKKTKRYGMTEL